MTSLMQGFANLSARVRKTLLEEISGFCFAHNALKQQVTVLISASVPILSQSALSVYTASNSDTPSCLSIQVQAKLHMRKRVFLRKHHRTKILSSFLKRDILFK